MPSAVGDMKWLSLMACALDSNAVGEIMNTSLVDCARGGGAIVAAAPRVGSHARRRLRTFSSPLSSAQACPRKVQERAKWQVGENAFRRRRGFGGADATLPIDLSSA